MAAYEDDFFDDLTPTYDEVIEKGTKTFEKIGKKRISQIYDYAGERYVLIWDKATGRNLHYATYDDWAKMHERKIDR